MGYNVYAQGLWTGAAATTFWNYNPGTATADSKLAATTAQEFLSPNFLNAPTSGNARLFLFGNATPGGGVTVQNNTFTMVANHTGGAHKLSLYNINNPHPVTSMFFTLNVSSIPTNGLIILGLGNSSGAVYTNIAQLSGSDQPGLFTALQFSVGASAITARFRGTTSPTHTYSSLSPTFAKGTDLAVELYCNNSASAQTYSRNSTLYTVPSGAFHIYVGGTALTSGGSANIPYSAEVAKGQAIDAFTFNGSDSSSPSSNALSFTVSDIKLGHNENVLPVTLNDFSAKKQGTSVKLDWSTTSEQNNQYFELFSARSDGQFVSMGKIKGSGNSQALQKYSYTDFNPSTGTNYYKLIQVDGDGAVNGPWFASANVAIANESLKAYVTTQQQLKLSYQAENIAAAQVTVSDISGRKILAKQLMLEKANNDIALDLSNVVKGLYIVSLIESGQQSTAKVLIK
jgi:hypothetical protein